MKIAVALLALAFAGVVAGQVALNARLAALEARLVKAAPPAPKAAHEDPAPAPAPAPPAPAPAPQPPPPAPAPAPAAAEFRQAVERVLDEIRREQDAQWQERVRKAGMDVLSKALALNAGQEQLVTPVVEEHLRKIQSFWWPGTVTDDSGQERTLTYEEKVRLSDEARRAMDERMRLFLTGAQLAAYEEWARQWRQEAPKRTGDVGPLRWF
jgi:hypothetical protein